MINNSYLVNSESFPRKRTEEFEESLKNLINVKSKILLFEDPQIYYDANILDGNEIWQDEVLKKLVISFFTQINPFDQEYCQKEELSESLYSILCVQGINNCLLSNVNEEKWKRKIVNIEIEDGFKKAHNVFDDQSLKDYFEENRLYILLDIYINNGIISKMGFNDYNFEKIVFHDSFIDEYKSSPKEISDKVIRIFIGVLLGSKKIENFDYHTESESVKQQQKLRNQRKVKFDGKDRTIYMHLKLTKDWSLYIDLNKTDNVMYVGKLTKHLDTKKY